MKRTLKMVVACALTAICTLSIAATTVKPVTVGILVPVALPAMTQIVNGFETTLSKESKTPVKYLVKNAQGHTNIQHSIF